MKRSPIIARASRRISRYGEMAAVITPTPLRESRSATNAIRRMFVSRSSFENPRPFERFVRTTSPSRTSTLRPRCASWCSTSSAIVDLPAPERPVNQSVNPSLIREALRRGLCVKPALGPVGAGPAAVATRPGKRAGSAADRVVALIVQRVVRDVVLGDVAPYVALGPVGQRRDLPEPVLL